MESKYKYLIGVDGGGTGTRIIVASPDQKILAEASGPPSALGQGIEKAWRAIMDTLALAFSKSHIPVPMLSECAIGLGLSGANNIIWKNEFYLRNPGFKKIIIDTDGFTTLMGAHGGSPGVIVALGTGSVGMVLKKDGKREDVSGWGFPSGDEASGAWLGMKASELTQKSFDGRRANSPLTEAVKKYCGKTSEEFLSWLGEARQNAFAGLAPLVFECSKDDKDAFNLLIYAGKEIALMVDTLDPKNEYPLSICGRLGEALIPFLPESILQKNQKALGDSTMGALTMIAQKLK